MADISAIVERLKNNKLAIPALAVGAIVGGYVLIKNGGLSGGGGSYGASQEDYVNDALAQAEQIASQGGGGSGGDAGGLALEQQGFIQSVMDYLNEFQGQVQNAINSQASQTQDAINAIAGQNEGAINSLYDELSKQAQAFSGYAQPDYSSLFAAMQSIPQQAYQQAAPQLQSLAPVNSDKIGNAIRQIAPTTQRILGGKVTGTFSRPSGLGLGIVTSRNTPLVKPTTKVSVRPGIVNTIRTQVKPVKPIIQTSRRQVLPTLMSYQGGASSKPKPIVKPKPAPIRSGGGLVLRK